MRLGSGIVFLNLAALDEVVENGESHIRAQCAGSIAQKQGGVHGLANFSALHDQRRLHAFAYGNQVMVYGADGQQRRDGGMLLVNVAVGENDVVHALVHAALGFVTEAVQRLLQSFRPLFRIEEHGELLCLESLIADVAKNIQLRVGQDGLRQTHHLAVGGVGGQDVGAYSADVFGQRHDQLFTDGVDGGVRHLSKLLTEIVEQNLRPVAHDGQRRVIAHGGDRLLSRGGHRHNRLVNVFLAVAEGDEFLLEVVDRVLHLPAALQFLQLHAVFAEPFAIGMCFGQLFLDFAVVPNLAFLCVDE